MQSNQSTRSQESQSLRQVLGAKNLYGYTKSDLPPLAKPDILVPNYIPRAVFPIISEMAFAKTMANFRVYIDEYNHATEWENVDIGWHNIQVEFFLKNKATDIQRRHAELFPKLNEDLNDRDYNVAADKVNNENGLIIRKNPIQLVKYPTEQLFQNMLHVYNCQLAKRNEQFIRLLVTTPTPLQPLSINSYFITQLQRDNGIKSLNICHKTVRNHRQRLEEAGVFIDYNFQGWQRGVQVHINPSILVFFDAHPNMLAGIENQTFSLWKGKMLLDSNEITQTIKDEYKDKNDASQSSFDKEQAKPAAFLGYTNLFYPNTGGNQQNSPVGAAPENVKVEKTLSENLRDLILHPQELAENLANKCYISYKPIDVRMLHAESMNGKLTDAEFRELIIQDFFKSSNRLWTETTPYVGSWKKAINHLMEHLFLNYRGKALGKERVIDYVEQLRYRLEGARRWFLSHDHRPLYPSDYFDVRRKTSQEMGFAYTIKAWQSHQQYLKTKDAKELQEEKKAAARLKRNADSTKYKREITRFLNGRISIMQLNNYVENNLPPDYLMELPKTIQKMMSEPAPARRKRKQPL